MTSPSRETHSVLMTWSWSIDESWLSIWRQKTPTQQQGRKHTNIIVEHVLSCRAAMELQVPLPQHSTLFCQRRVFYKKVCWCWGGGTCNKIIIVIYKATTILLKRFEPYFGKIDVVIGSRRWPLVNFFGNKHTWTMLSTWWIQTVRITMTLDKWWNTRYLIDTIGRLLFCR